MGFKDWVLTNINIDDVIQIQTPFLKENDTV